ncbi:MAG: deoxyribodipyrimidine photo-lyase, partial [Actinobacteria bacterium]|nr:deoxyribodipyrimidine photo-lyase [Actinomycetota bacterium]
MGDVVWLRRDLRRSDLPTLARAADAGPVTVAFVIDPALWDPSA